MQYLHVMGVPIPLEDTVFSPNYSPNQPLRGILEEFRCWLFLLKLRAIMQLERVCVYLRQLYKYNPDYMAGTNLVMRLFRLREAEFDTLNYCLSQLFIPHICPTTCDPSRIIHSLPDANPLYRFTFQICPRCLKHSISTGFQYRKSLGKFYPELCAFTYPPSAYFTRRAPMCPADVAFFYFGMIFPDFYFSTLATKYTVPLPATMEQFDHQAFLEWALYYKSMDRHSIWLGPWWSHITPYNQDLVFPNLIVTKDRLRLERPFHVFMKF